MSASRNAPIPLICILAMASTAGAVNLAQTGTNTVTGTAVVDGDIFATETLGTATDSLYSGVWAHAYVPSGTEGINSASSERTVPARTETRSPTLGSKAYTLTNSYGDTTVIAKASKTGALGSAEAFAEVSSLSSATDTSTSATTGSVGGQSQMAAFVTHSGTGTAEASASGSADYSAMLDTGEILARGSVDGSVALTAENNYGGTVTGAAWKASTSLASSATPDAEFTASQSFEYLSLASDRNALSAKSEISGTAAGDASASGFYALPLASKFGNTESSAAGDLSASAVTSKIGDSIMPGRITLGPLTGTALTTRLDSLTTGTSKSITGSLWSNFLGAGAPTASAYLMSQGTVSTTGASHTSTANTESMTSAGVTRTLADASAVYGDSYIDNGAISASANTASAAGGGSITLASAGADTISMGSGAHLVSRLTGAVPQSAADFTIASSMSATSGAGASSTGSVAISGNADKSAGGNAHTLVKVVGPAFSPGGTSADATGSYLTALNIDGTAAHARDAAAGFTSVSALIADDIDEVNVWCWIDGSDARTHAESAYGLSPFVSTPVYTSDPPGVAGATEGPAAISGATATSRSVDTIFRSSI
ncbi:MAG TPA: hypothetical protein VN455_09955 [Methanotrichaceae archaeon]|nr:hypothetical protein [Methanotrichaceae archaeon]